MNQELPDIQLDGQNLVKETVYTDQKIGSIRVLTPVTMTGEADTTRETTYFGQTQAMTPSGPLPLNFELEADSLASAVELFGETAKLSMQKTLKEIQDYQREQASKIVVPGQPANSQIQMP